MGEVAFDRSCDEGEDVAVLLAAGFQHTHKVSTKRLPAELCVPKDSFRQITA